MTLGPQTEAACYVRQARHSDEFASSVTFDGWDMQYTQMSAGRYEGESLEVKLPGLQLYTESWNTTAHHRGTARRDSYVFGIPCEISGEGRLNGQPWQQEASVFKGETVYDALVPPMKLLVACIDRDALSEYLETVEHMPPPEQLIRGTRLVAAPLQAAAARRMFLSMISQCRTDPAVLGHPATRASMLQASLQVLAPLASNDLTPMSLSCSAFNHTQIVRRAREFMLSRIDEPLQIIDVCHALRVSRRMLQYSFQSVLDINPVAYLRLLRLNGARADLISAHPGTSAVQDVQARWGFWHGSRFSAEYRRMYDELPSDTLRRAAQRQVR